MANEAAKVEELRDWAAADNAELTAGSFFSARNLLASKQSRLLLKKFVSHPNNPAAGLSSEQHAELLSHFSDADHPLQHYLVRVCDCFPAQDSLPWVLSAGQQKLSPSVHFGTQLWCCTVEQVCLCHLPVVSDHDLGLQEAVELNNKCAQEKDLRTFLHDAVAVPVSAVVPPSVWSRLTTVVQTGFFGSAGDRSYLRVCV